MTPHDSALDEDTDGDDKLVPRQSPSTGGAKSTKRNRLGKNQRQLLKDAAKGKVVCLDTVSVPISNNIPLSLLNCQLTPCDYFKEHAHHKGHAQRGPSTFGHGYTQFELNSVPTKLIDSILKQVLGVLQE